MNTVHVFPAAPPIEERILSRFRNLATPTVSDSMERTPGSTGLFPVGNSMASVKGHSMAGTALTVRTRPGDNLSVHCALDMARPGDVLVIDARGELVNAILGELMTLYAASRGVVGIVVDGAVRDSDIISAGPIPVFARGFSHLGPYKSGPGAIHGPVTIGGCTVQDGDIVIGDADGLAFVPMHRALEVVVAAEAVVEKEIGQREAIQHGTWDRSWVAQVADIVYGEGAGL
jgi:regulator of RNase E activity RraA